VFGVVHEEWSNDFVMQTALKRKPVINQNCRAAEAEREETLPDAQKYYRLGLRTEPGWGPEVWVLWERNWYRPGWIHHDVSLQLRSELPHRRAGARLREI